jgi:hypothetical protein
MKLVMFALELPPPSSDPSARVGKKDGARVTVTVATEVESTLETLPTEEATEVENEPDLSVESMDSENALASSASSTDDREATTRKSTDQIYASKRRACLRRRLDVDVTVNPRKLDSDKPSPLANAVFKFATSESV